MALLSCEAPVAAASPASPSLLMGLTLQTLLPSPAAASAFPLAPAKTTQAPAHAPQRHIWLVAGPAGCGKTTIARVLSAALGLPYVEGDEFHSPSNIEKMASGVPLTDADRWDWLTALRDEFLRQLADGHDGVVVTCSALKRKYRDVIRVAPYYAPNVALHFILLHAPEHVVLARVARRRDHFMQSAMVRSQFSILEPPAPAEADVIPVDVSHSPADVELDVITRVRRVMEAAKSG